MVKRRGIRLKRWPVFEEYTRRYPAVALEVATRRTFVDIVLEGFDAGDRIAESVPKDVIAIPIGPQLAPMCDRP
jgi:DNA-binding transcriptional LysR family regulator